jgi:hypothetical protein
MMNKRQYHNSKNNTKEKRTTKHLTAHPNRAIKYHIPTATTKDPQWE